MSLWTDVNANRDAFVQKWYRKREGMLKIQVQQKDLPLWTHWYLRHADGDWPSQDLISALIPKGM